MFEDQQPVPAKELSDKGAGTPITGQEAQPQSGEAPVAPIVAEEKKVEDIFGHIDKDTATTVAPNSMPPISGAGSSPVMTAATTGSGKKGLIIAVAVILLLILGAGAFFAWKWVKAGQSTNVLGENLKQEDNGQIDESGKGKIPPKEVVDSVPVGVDSDSDGLTDADEILAGTNPQEVDTDKDNLFDYDEVKVYQTNPVLADTDGDGYLDGDEVKNGFDPKGPGKLFNLQEELQKMNGVN